MSKSDADQGSFLDADWQFVAYEAKKQMVVTKAWPEGQQTAYQGGATSGYGKDMSP